jgi:hypothetical protein
VDYREKRFDWVGMMAELYHLYTNFPAGTD